MTTSVYFCCVRDLSKYCVEQEVYFRSGKIDSSEKMRLICTDIFKALQVNQSLLSRPLEPPATTLGERIKGWHSIIEENLKQYLSIYQELFSSKLDPLLTQAREKLLQQEGKTRAVLRARHEKASNSPEIKKIIEVGLHYSEELTSSLSQDGFRVEDLVDSNPKND